VVCEEDVLVGRQCHTRSCIGTGKKADSFGSAPTTA
jgi:hypothetical protein